MPGVFAALTLTPMHGNLFTVATVTETSNGDASWAGNGYGWDSAQCPVELLVTDYCQGIDGMPIAATDAAINEGWPFGVITKHVCATLGMSADERRDVARQQIEIGTIKAVERELQKGEAVQSVTGRSSHYLADADAAIVSSGAVPVREGLAALEQALADCGVGAQGVIHMTRSTASMLGGAVQRDDSDPQRLVTRLGTPVVAGVGYDPAVKVPATSTGPELVEPKPLPATQWMYATGPVAVHLGPIDVLDEIVDRTTNTMTVLGARPAAVYFDSCCHFAAEVTLA